MLSVASKLAKDYKTGFVKYSLVVIVVVMSAVIRLHKIDTAPYGTLVDEASYGYIAYSLSETGKDELGNALPFSFKAFGDYKMPVYAYTLVPTIRLFGLSNLSVRLPSVVSGVLITYLTYFILRKLHLGFSTSILSTLIVAFSPWSILLSRFAFESNVALFLFMASIACFVSYLQSRNKYLLILSSILLGFTWYTYIAYRMATIGIVVATSIYLIASKRITRRSVILFIATFILVILPLMPTIFSSSGTARFSQIGLFSNESIVSEISEFRGLCYKDWPRVVCNVIVNRPVAWIGSILQNLFSSLSLEFLFLSGDKGLLYLTVSNYGAFLLPTIVLYFAGIVALFGKDRNKSSIILFVSLVFLALIPSALVGLPQKVRLSPFFPFAIFLFAMGYEQIMIFLHRFGTRAKNAFTLVYGVIICTLGLIYSLNMTYVHFVKFSQEYAGPLRGAIVEANSKYKNIDTYFASDLHDAIIHYAFYTKISPASYQKFAKYSVPDSGDFSHPISYKNVHMQSISVKDIYCMQKNTGKDFVFITTKNLELSGESLYPPVYKYLSHDKNSSLMYIYYFDHKNDIKCNKVL